MPEDWLLRLIEQVSLILAELSRLKTGEKPARISALCLRETGLPLDFVKHSSPKAILQLLESGGGTQYVRGGLLAELLLQDDNVSEESGKSREAGISRAQDQALMAYSIGNLEPDRQREFRHNLEEKQN